VSQPEPDWAGTVARAWRVDVDSPEAIARHEREWGYAPGGVRGYWVNGPYHPFWSWWMVSVTHLRPIPGAPPAHKLYPDAEYEFTIWSVDSPPKGPEFDISRVITGDMEGRGRILHPADVTFQFHGVTDLQSADICDDAVRAILDGMSCDSDFRQWWLDSLATTVKHYQEGRHG
jgi:hypothetical protein